MQPRVVPVTVTELSLQAYDHGLARLRVQASAGFYVRSLAHDLGQRLGCGAHLETLRRVRAGTFDEDSAVPLDAIEAEGTGASRWIVPIDRLLPNMPAAVLTDRGVTRAAHGNDVTPADVATPAALACEGDLSPARRCRILDPGGHLLGIAETRPGGALHPVIVLV